MSHTRFIAAARLEFLAEVIYYSEAQVELGVRFTAAVEDAAARALAVPLSGSPFRSNTRRVLVKEFPFSRERFMGIGQLLTMPMFFASNAIYPLDIMPGWLRVVAQLNPLACLVDALRGLMIVGGESVHGYGVDFAVLIAVFVVLLMVAVRLYPTLVE